MVANGIGGLRMASTAAARRSREKWPRVHRLRPLRLDQPTRHSLWRSQAVVLTTAHRRVCLYLNFQPTFRHRSSQHLRRRFTMERTTTMRLHCHPHTCRRKHTTSLPSILTCHRHRHQWIHHCRKSRRFLPHPHRLLRSEALTF